MPVLNERRYLEHAVGSVLAQELTGPSELVLALGPSTDGTTELAQKLAAEDDRIRLVDNPAAHIPVGLNTAIRASRYPTIVRVDGEAIDRLSRWSARYFGDTSPGAATARFEAAIDRLWESATGRPEA